VTRPVVPSWSANHVPHPRCPRDGPYADAMDTVTASDKGPEPCRFGVAKPPTEPDRVLRRHGRFRVFPGRSTWGAAVVDGPGGGPRSPRARVSTGLGRNGGRAPPRAAPPGPSPYRRVIRRFRRRSPGPVGQETCSGRPERVGAWPPADRRRAPGAIAVFSSAAGSGPHAVPAKLLGAGAPAGRSGQRWRALIDGNPAWSFPVGVVDCAPIVSRRNGRTGRLGPSVAPTPFHPPPACPEWAR